MSDWPIFAMPAPPVLTPFHAESIGGLMSASSTWRAADGSSTAWQSNDLALYFPFSIEMPATIRQFACFNGAGVNGTFDLGVYDAATLKKLASTGATSQSGTSALQVVDIADVDIPAGKYLLAMTVSTTTTARYIMAVNSNDENVLPGVPVYSEALGSSVLPATATPVLATPATINVPVFGVVFAPTF